MTLDAPSILAGLSIGSSLGVIAGARFAGGRAQEKIEDAENAALRWQRAFTKADIARMKLQAERQRRLAPLKAANAARKQAKLDRDKASRDLRDARHAEMRELVGEVI